MRHLVTVNDMQARTQQAYSIYLITKRFCARVFLVASRLSIVCVSVFNISENVRNGFWRNFQRRSAM